jgi:multimeric flavodoxin WrbA
MSKRVLIIETSLRNDSNSDRLAESFAQGARDGGNEVEILSLKGKNIDPM